VFVIYIVGREIREVTLPEALRGGAVIVTPSLVDRTVLVPVAEGAEEVSVADAFGEGLSEKLAPYFPIAFGWAILSWPFQLASSCSIFVSFPVALQDEGTASVDQVCEGKRV
jgi:hypothetical protein